MSPGVQVDHVPAGPVTSVPKDDLLPFMGAFADHLTQTWRHDRPDLVHAHFWMSGFAAVTAAGASDLPVLQTFHALGTVKQRWQRQADTSPSERIRIEGELARTVDQIIATCSDEVSELWAMGAPQDRIDVVPCGVDTALFTGNANSVRNISQPARLLVLGRLVPRKGVDDAIRALSMVPDADLIVVGGPVGSDLDLDPEVLRLRDLAVRCGVADRVRFLGRIGHDRLPALIRSCDLVIAPPLYEPFGIVPLEAMACGIPVVGTAVGGLLDTVVQGVTGLLVEPADPAALAAGIRALLADDRRRTAMGAAGQARVRAHFGWDEVAARTEAAYAGALARRTRTSSAMEALR
jgi:glycosyltransferase involved in cell wall biosynthesis